MPQAARLQIVCWQACQFAPWLNLDNSPLLSVADHVDDHIAPAISVVQHRLKLRAFAAKLVANDGVLQGLLCDPNCLPRIGHA